MGARIRMGHMRIPNIPPTSAGCSERLWTGNCPFHGNWLGRPGVSTARARRSALWAQAGLEPPDANVLESEYIAPPRESISAYRPERVRSEWRLMHNRSTARVRQRRANCSTRCTSRARRMEELVVGPGLGDAAGCGAILWLGAELGICRTARLVVWPVTYKQD